MGMTGYEGCYGVRPRPVRIVCFANVTTVACRPAHWTAQSSEHSLLESDDLDS